MNITTTDKACVRELAKQYLDVCHKPVQQKRRDLWRQKNSLQSVRPLIYVRAWAWHEMEASQCQCEDPLLRSYENHLRSMLFWDSLDDDSTFEPWLTVDAVKCCYGWGVETVQQKSAETGGAYKEIYPLETLEDISRLVMPWHEINEEGTARKAAIVQDMFGDILPVVVNREPAYCMWQGDLSTNLGHLRGIENFMLDMMDEPEQLHALMQFLSDGVRRTYDQAEAAGDWSYLNHQNQAMPYAEELHDPACDGGSVKRKQLWSYAAAQEFTLVSPAMHEEFLLNYQLPILESFGLVAYGCCEDLTKKIDMLRKIPNLRRIAVSPFANVASCAEQIGKDYVASYRPSPADMVAYGFDAARIRSILKKDFSSLKNCHFDITLKDVETVGKDPDRVRKWVALTREVMAEEGLA